MVSLSECPALWLAGRGFEPWQRPPTHHHLGEMQKESSANCVTVAGTWLNTIGMFAKPIVKAIDR